MSACATCPSLPDLVPAPPQPARPPLGLLWTRRSLQSAGWANSSPRPQTARLPHTCRLFSNIFVSSLAFMRVWITPCDSKSRKTGAKRSSLPPAGVSAPRTSCPEQVQEGPSRSIGPSPWRCARFPAGRGGQPHLGGGSDTHPGPGCDGPGCGHHLGTGARTVRFISALPAQKTGYGTFERQCAGKKIFLMYPFLIKIKCVEFLKFRHSCLLSVSKGNCLPRGPGDVCSPRSCSVLSLAELSVIYMGPSPNFVVNFY